MASQPVIDAAAVIEGQARNRFVLRLMLLSCSITFFDGFDLQVVSYLAAYLTEDFGIDRKQMGAVFSAGIFGTMVGGFIFGWLGDRHGRRPMIVLATTAFALLTMASALARTLPELIGLRFLAGLAIGGVLPICWALNIEYAPRRFRATVVTLVMLGYTVGSAVGAPVTNWIAPRYGWQGVFVAGGLATLVVAGLLALLLPESARFLVARGRRPDRVARYLNAIDPALGATADSRFVLGDEDTAQHARFHVSSLFAGVLRWITPLLWTAYVASSVATFFKSSWSPLVLEIMGFSRSEAAIFASLTSLGGAMGGLLLMRFTDRSGPVAIAAMSASVVPVLLFAGLAPIGPMTFVGLNFATTVLMGGVHYGMHSISGLFYPSSIRANGAGWATSIAKIGSIAGPLVGGFILATNFSVRNIFALLAVCPLTMAICLMLLVRAQRRQARADLALPPDPTAVTT